MQANLHGGTGVAKCPHSYDEEREAVKALVVVEDEALTTKQKDRGVLRSLHSIIWEIRIQQVGRLVS